MNKAENIPVWDLSVYYDNINSKAILSDAKKALQLSEDFHVNYKGKINNNSLITAPFLKKLLNKIKFISETISKPNSFLFLLYSTDLTNTKVKRLLGIVEEIGAQIANNMLFFTLEFNQLDDKIKKELINNKELSEYSYYLQKIVDEKKFQLSEKEEKLINIKSVTGVNAFKNLYNKITNKYRFKIDIQGKEKILSEAELEQFRYTGNAFQRQQSAEIQFLRYKQDGDILTEIYNNIIKDLTLENNLRGFKSNISAENFANEISDTAIQNLITTTNDNNHILREYYKILARNTNSKKLKICDIKANLNIPTKKFSWNEAKEIILQAFNDFDEKYYKLAKQMFEKNRIHAKILDNKTDGAYCFYSSPQTPPFVFLNYLGSTEDVITLAHELGHAIHGFFSRKQNILNYLSISPFAEISSLFTELIVLEKLLSVFTTKQEKLALLTEKINIIFRSTFRQNIFTNFELKAHNEVKQGFIDFKTLSNFYFSELQKAYGNSLEILDVYHYEWLTIHYLFLTPFYCYSYNFAQLFVLGLYEKFLEDGNIFKKNYFKLLESGGNNTPEKLAKILSININDTEIWQKGFDLINNKFLLKLKELV